MLEKYIAYWAGQHPDKTAIIFEAENKKLTWAQLYCRLQASDQGDIILKGLCESPLVLFTTGTTGKSKGVVISPQAIEADAENLVDAHGYTSDITFIVTGSLDHLGSLSKLWPMLMVGGTIHIIPGIKDPNIFFKAIADAEGKVATFLVPANIRFLLSLCRKELEQCARVIDFIETGAAAMAQKDMEELCKVLPHSRLYNTYASTETGIISTYDFNNNPCVAGCLGKPMKNSSFFITTEGTVACSGKTLMTGYLDDEELTREVLRDGVVYTHDLGFIDNDGCLHLTGRADDIINVGGFKVNPQEVEDAAMLSPIVKECVCVADTHPVIGTIAHLIVVTKDGEPLDKRHLAAFLDSKLERYKVPQNFSQAESLHRTFNGKIDRKAYRNK